MKKILFVASVSGHLDSFHIPYMKWFKDVGYEVHATAKNTIDHKLPVCDKFIEIPFCRSPYNSNNFKVYKQLKELLYQENYDIVHCHTPMASALCRMAARRLRKKGLKVIYTAHGFHFFKGGPLIGWLVYYPIEKFLSYYTDIIININTEDYENSLSHKFECGEAFLVPGVGVDAGKVVKSTESVKQELRKLYGFNGNDFVLIYAAEFISRKNHQLIIRQIPKIKDRISNLKVIFAGEGDLLYEMKELAQMLGVYDNIYFLGFRKDVPQLVALSDVGISTSKQEGLPMNVAEYMFAGLPVVVSNDRGHKEMVVHGKNGFLFDIKEPDQFSESIIELYRNPDLRVTIGKKAEESIQRFSLDNAMKAHARIYRTIL